jgi:uncharacterized protein with HEPN domain
MKEQISNEARLRHILDAIIEIESYIKDFSLADFTANSLVRNATVRQLEIIGEASKHLTEDLRMKYHEINWDEISGLRNIIVHEYFIVDNNILWDIVTNDIPPLKTLIAKIITEEFN